MLTCAVAFPLKARTAEAFACITSSLAPGLAVPMPTLPELFWTVSLLTHADPL
jgi:hypothetical protein